MKPILYLIFSFFSLSVFASTQTLSLKEIIEKTRERAPLIRSRMAEVEAMEARTKQSSLLSNPSFMLQTGAIKSGTMGGSVVDLTIMQPLPFPGKRSALQDLSRATAKLSKLEGEEEILAMEHHAVQMGIRLAVLDELFLHTKERRRNFDLVRKSLMSTPAASPVQKVERALIENQLRILERGIALMESERRTLNSELNTWIGVEGEISVPVKWGYVSQLDTLSYWKEQAQKNNPRLKQHTARMEMGEARLKTAELSRYPDFQIGVNYRKEAMQPSNNFYHAQIGITIPIFDRGQHQRSAAKAELHVEEARLSVQERILLSQLTETWEMANTHRKLLKTFNLDLIKESEKQFHAAESEFRKGRIDATTFLSTDAQIHESVDAAFQTTLDAMVASNRLRELAGLTPEI